MRALIAGFIVVLLAACTAVEHRQQALYSPLLSASDIAEITALVEQRPDIRQPIYEIATEEHRRDRATVRTGRWRDVGDQADYFTVQKRRGRWHIVSPIRQDRLKRIITVS